MSLPVTFIGGGQMCEALLKGILASGITKAADVVVTNPGEKRRSELQARYPGITTSTNNVAAMQRTPAAGIVILAMKPQSLAKALEGIKARPEALVMSILAGVTLRQLGALFPPGTALCRVMPNTPSLVGEGAAGYVLGEGVGEEGKAKIEKVLGAVCGAVVGPLGSEDLLHTVTGISGSAPAYFYMMIEALADAGSLRLAHQTCIGAGEMVKQTGDHPAVLKDKVTSPGGTTIAAVAALEEAGFRSAVLKAVEKCVNRSQELAKLYE